ncbi:MAG: hypothetical protein Q9174_001991 [Haloplaca sp. 1 TL-2023]
MPSDDFEMVQSASDKKEKMEKPPADAAEPESFYREAGAKKEVRDSKESSKDTSSAKPSIPQRTQKPRIRRSTDDLDSRDSEKDPRVLRKDIEELRQELRGVLRENRDQSLELRDVKKMNAHLKETLTSQDHPKSYKEQILSERRQFYHHVELMEDHIRSLTRQLEKTKLHMDQLTFQTREANEEKAKYEANLQSLQKQNNRLNDDLTECRDDILRLQPPSQIPDSKIADEYANLYQQIASWVDDEADDSSSMETRLERLHHDKDAPELLKEFVDDDLIQIARKYSDAEPLLLRCIIQLHLHQDVLADDLYLFGLDNHSITLLRTIAHSMEDLEPKRDALTIQRWRSETLQALAKIDGFQAEQHHQAIKVTKEIWSSLTYLLPEIASQGEKGWLRFHEKVTMPAVQLATNMRFSTSCYRIIPHFPRQDKIIYHPDIQKFMILDVSTSKALRYDSVLKVAEDGRIGEHVMVIQPLLLRMQRDRNGGIPLCKPVVAIKLDEPMAKKTKAAKAFAGWTSSWFGGDMEPGRS